MPTLKDFMSLLPATERAKYTSALATLEHGLVDARALDNRLKERFPKLHPTLRNALSIAGVVLNR